MPSASQVRATRTATSPRLAIRMRWNSGGATRETIAAGEARRASSWDEDRLAGQRAVGLARLRGRHRVDAEAVALERVARAREAVGDDHAIARRDRVGR